MVSPQQRTSLVAALVSDQVGRSRLRRAVETFAPLRFCNSPENLLELVRVERPGYVIVEPWDAIGRSTAPLISALRREARDVRILAYCRLEPDDGHELPALGRAGVDAVFFRDMDDVGPTVVDLLENHDDSDLAIKVSSRILSIAPPSARAIVLHCVRHANESLTVEALAHAFGTTPRALVRRLAQVRLPPPNTIIMWCRLLRAGAALIEPGATTRNVALAHGFGTPSNLRRALRHHTGLDLRDMRGPDALERMVTGLLATTTSAALHREA